jgi:hypothetical protein
VKVYKAIFPAVADGSIQIEPVIKLITIKFKTLAIVACIPIFSDGSIIARNSEASNREIFFRTK